MARKFVIFVAFIFSLYSLADSTITLQNNGYSGILVGISEDVPQPLEDNGAGFIQDLKDLLTKSSEALHRATNQRVFFKDFDILLPRSWNKAINGLPVTNTRDVAPNKADIRLVPADPVSGNKLPFTFHSGKCGVSGDHMEIPVDYLNSTIFGESVAVKAKAVVQEWSKFRYGVFEEHGYPNDEVLPYFYRHPDGYDALSSSNDTEIKGELQSVNGGSCQVTNGVIADKDGCRFVPSPTGQTATSSLMSFHWVDSVVGYSEDGKHNQLAPHRQNRLCNVKSSWEVISSSDDIASSSPAPDANTVPNFKVWRNLMEPVLYIAVDTSYHSAGNYLGLLKRELSNLISRLRTNNPDVYVGLATFQGEDSVQSGYVKEAVAPIRVADGATQLTDAINAITFPPDPSFSKRNVLAVFREVLPKLVPRSELGGSFLYIATLKNTEGNDTTYLTELEVSQTLIRNNVKLFIAETGDGRASLGRLSALSDGYYLTGTTLGSAYPFPPISNEITKTLNSILNIERAMVVDLGLSLETSKAMTGSFLIDGTADLNTTAVLQSPREGLITVTLESPSKQQIILNNQGADDTNWFLMDSNIGVSSFNLTANGAVAGKWSYSIIYDKSSCSSCPNSVDILFQVSTSRNPANAQYLPELNTWFSTDPGTTTADMSKSPLIVSARFDTPKGRVGSLDVRAEIIDESKNIKSVALRDVGSEGTDIARDGIYSGVFIPESDGKYTVNIMASQSAQSGAGNKIIAPNQEWFCCGTNVPTISATNFYRMYNKVAEVNLVNTNSGGQAELPSAMNDLTSSTYGVDNGKVIINMIWTVPPYVSDQKVKFSDNPTSLIENIDTASDATVEYGSIPLDEGAAANIYVSAPYEQNKNIYFAVQVTSIDGKTVGSNLVWADKNPPEVPFTTPDPSDTTSTIVTDITSTTTETSPFTTETSTISTEPTTLPTTVETTALSSTEQTTTLSTSEPSTDALSTTEPSTTLSTTEQSTTLSTTEQSTTLSTTEQTTTLPTTEQTTVTIETTTVTDSTTLYTDSTPTTTVTASTTTASPNTTDSTTVTTSSTATMSTEENMESTSTEGITEPTSTEGNMETSTTEATNTTLSNTETTSTVANSETTPTEATVSTNATTDSSPPASSSTEATELTTENPDNGLTGAEIGYIVGAAVAGLVIGAAVIGLIFFCKSKSASSSSFPSTTQPSSPPNSGYGQQPLAYQAAARSAPQQSSVAASSYENFGYAVGDEEAPPRYQSSQKPKPAQDPPARQRSERPPSYGLTVEDDDTLLTAL